MRQDLISFLEETYRSYHLPELISPDPLEVVRAYPDPRDAEVAALICSAYAYGRVNQILKALRAIMTSLGPSPHEHLRAGKAPSGVCHRFTSREDTCRFLNGIGELLRRYGSVKGAFMGEEPPSNREELIWALEGFALLLGDLTGLGNRFLMPLPSGGGACKRWFLMLRWLVRRDSVDLGLWSEIPASALLVPMDAHMFRFAKSFGLVKRSSPDLKAAKELTDRLMEVDPWDPVRFDFSITRRGILGPLG
ncbi:TIGR02757 family protein [Thermanaerovibrio velox DSM 12556]|uniref:TIGR02757 family protein n=1 Tax=Thermanaerovibrio velox DSM 12556 TaxID=926567 RepID=H0UQA8_9BACT|nr:TIGR02757 family protein [Thermanaerovibrio velox]EHM10746.1 TIGR02757 family protein [Thermanaerovibrio velox DSM 12556]